MFITSIPSRTIFPSVGVLKFEKSVHRGAQNRLQHESVHTGFTRPQDELTSVLCCSDVFSRPSLHCIVPRHCNGRGLSRQTTIHAYYIYTSTVCLAKKKREDSLVVFSFFFSLRLLLLYITFTRMASSSCILRSATTTSTRLGGATARVVPRLQRFDTDRVGDEAIFIIFFYCLSVK